MNIARMLSIPTDIEKAIMLIKIGRTRKIDVGCITKLDGEKLSESHFFLESAGVGLEAEIQQHILEMERGDKSSVLKIFKKMVNFDSHQIKLVIDNETVNIDATLVSIANGPMTGANLMLAPKAKLNDHRLTVTVYNMSKKELFNYFLKMKTSGKTDLRKLNTYQTKKLRVEADNLFIHADARLFGSSPAEFKIIPNALNIITGFPSSQDGETLVKKTFLDP